MANSPLNIENFGLKYGGYEDPKAFEPFHLILLGLDLIFNWVIDWAHIDPLAILVIFVFQCLGLILNLVVYIMASGSQAMQSGLKKSLIYHHEVHLINSLLYISLTAFFYVWALRKSWPSVSDQFSFSFGSSEEEIPTTLLPFFPANNTTLITTPTPLTTLTPLLSNMTDMANSSKFVRSFTHIKNLFTTKASKTSGSSIISGNSTKELYTLWTPGFVAIYTIQRTVAIIYYFVSLKATFLVLNAATIDNLEEKRGRRRIITKSLGNVALGERRNSLEVGGGDEEFLRRSESGRGRNVFRNPLILEASKKVRMASAVSNVLKRQKEVSQISGRI